MKCPECGFENEVGVRFCGNCGTKLIQTNKPGSEGKKFCPNCGKQNPVEARFCEDCGSAILLPGNLAVTANSDSQPIPPPAIRQTRSFAWLWAIFGLGLVALVSGAVYIYWASKSPEPLQTQLASPTSPPQEPFISCFSEDIVYSEDFEDGQIQNWNGDQQFLSIITIAPALDDSENKVLIVRKPASTDGQIQAFAQLIVPSFSNAYLSARFYVDGSLPSDNSNWFSFNWLFSPVPVTVDGEQVFDSRYQLPVGYNYFEMRRLQQPLTNISVDHSVINPVSGKWYQLEIATFDGYTTVWLDGEMAMDYQDSKPLPEGTLGFEAWLTDPDIRLLFDDIKRVRQVK